MTKRSSPTGSGWRRKGTVRERYKVVALLLKPSLGLFGFLGRRRVLLPHPGSATGHQIALGDHHTLQHIQVHFGVDFQADFENVWWHDVALTWNHAKDHNRCWKLCFHHPGHVPVIRGSPDLHFESADNGPVVITWIGSRAWVVQRRISDLARWTLCHFQTWLKAPIALGICTQLAN